MWQVGLVAMAAFLAGGLASAQTFEHVLAPHNAATTGQWHVSLTRTGAATWHIEVWTDMGNMPGHHVDGISVAFFS